MENLDHESFDIAKLDGDGIGGKLYYNQRVEQIHTGRPTWMRRNFESGLRVYDYFVNGSRFATLVEDDLTSGFEAFTGKSGQESLSTEPVDLASAVRLIEEFQPYN